MRTFLFISGIFFILLFSSVHAQAADVIDPVWDAINNILATLGVHREKIGVIKEKLEGWIDIFNAFAVDTNASIQALQQTDASLQNQLTATNVQVQENTDSINVHTQQLDDLNQTTNALNQTDFSLQTQITDNNTAFTTYAAQTDAHLQTLDMTDANLQTQINGMTSVGVSRNNVYEVVNSSPTEHTAFCEDNNDVLLFGYCMGRVLGSATYPESLFIDDFEDYDYVYNPPWGLVRGNGLYVGDAQSGPLAGKLVSGNVYGELSSQKSFISLPLEMSQKFTIINQTEYGLALTNHAGPFSQSNDNGYLLYLRNGVPNISFFRLQGGNVTELFTTGLVPLQAGSEHIMRAERDSSSNWKIYIDDIQHGPTVTDNIFQSFDYIHTYIGGTGGIIDDINITAPGIPSQVQSPLLNIYDFNAPMGVECAVNGSARALCLRID